jgi:hypothetical protein
MKSVKTELEKVRAQKIKVCFMDLNKCLEESFNKQNNDFHKCMETYLKCRKKIELTTY